MSHYCFGDFKVQARSLLSAVCGPAGNTDYNLQRKQLYFIAEFSNWDKAHEQPYLKLSRRMIKVAHPEEETLVGLIELNLIASKLIK